MNTGLPNDGLPNGSTVGQQAKATSANKMDDSIRTCRERMNHSERCNASPLTSCLKRF